MDSSFYDLNQDKPYRGTITDWSMVHVHTNHDYGQQHLGYYIAGTFVTHPQFAGKHGWTSLVVKHVKDGDDEFVETLNSRYHLDKPYDENNPPPMKMSGW